MWDHIKFWMTRSIGEFLGGLLVLAALIVIVFVGALISVWWDKWKERRRK